MPQALSGVEHPVHSEGFEPSTPRAEIWYSIQLNYECSDFRTAKLAVLVRFTKRSGDYLRHYLVTLVFHYQRTQAWK